MSFRTDLADCLASLGMGQAMTSGVPVVDAVVEFFESRGWTPPKRWRITTTTRGHWDLVDGDAAVATFYIEAVADKVCDWLNEVWP